MSELSQARDAITMRAPTNDDPLWHKWYEDYVALLQSQASERDADPVALAVIEACRERLETVRVLLAKRPRWSAQRSLMIFRLLHEVDGDLLLIVPADDLAGRALDIRAQFDINVSDKVLRNEWLTSGRIEAVVHRCLDGADAADGSSAVVLDGEEVLLEPARGGRPERLRQDRRLLRSALGVVNEITDREFWRFAMNMRLQIWSTLVLVILLAGVVPLELHHLRPQWMVPPFPYPWWPFRITVSGMHMLWLAISVGAAGAIVSNMLAAHEFRVPYGQAFQAHVYYLVVVPIVGAVAALFVVAVEQSGMLFSVQQAAVSEGGKTAPLLINVGSRAAEDLAFVVIAAASGFFGDRALRNTMGKVFEELFGRASKEKSSTDS